MLFRALRAPTARFVSQAAPRVSAPAMPIATAWQSRTSFDAPQQPTLAPKLELYDIRDDPAHGSLFRATFTEGNPRDNVMPRITISVFPQLGPRKIDPSDPTPQFDVTRRTSVRLLPSEAGAIIAVLEAQVNSVTMKNKGFSLTVSRIGSGVSLAGEIYKDEGKTTVPFAANVSNTNVLSFFRFLESCINESFGFKYIAARALYRRIREMKRSGNATSATSTNAGNTNNGTGATNRFRQNNNNNRRRSNYNNNNNNNNRRRNGNQPQQQQQQNTAAQPAATTTAAKTA